MLRHIRHILHTKGPILAVRRLLDILGRFAMGRRNFRKRLKGFEEVFNRKGLKGTFFVTGILLDRHSDLVAKLAEQGHCLAVHGHHHVRMDQCSPEMQEELVAAGAAAFRKHGYEPSGFRPPYLNYNRDTIDALRSWGYSWCSCRYLLNSFPETESEGAGDEVARLEDLYHIGRLSEQISIPRDDSGIVDIPVTGPDDELMVDRYRITDPEIMYRNWLVAWKECHENCELYHLMFHPERFHMLADRMEELFREIRENSPPVWIASLLEIAEWWKKRGEVRIELDLDGFRPLVLFRDMPEEGTVLLHNPAGAGSRNGDSLLRGSLVLEPDTATADGPVYTAGRSDRVFAVGLSRSFPVSAEAYLQEEGYLTLRTDDPEKCSVFLDQKGQFSPQEERRLLSKIESCSEPLLRLWRWPGRYESAATFSADICAIDFWDFVARSWHFHQGRG